MFRLGTELDEKMGCGSALSDAWRVLTRSSCSAINTECWEVLGVTECKDMVQVHHWSADCTLGHNRDRRSS